MPTEMRDWRKIEGVRAAGTCNEMRAEIFRLRHFNSMVRAVLDMAAHTGMNAEDQYVLLAYHALKAGITAQQQVLEFSSCLVRPTVIRDEE